MHALFEGSKLSSSCSLGLIHGEICIPQQVSCVIGVSADGHSNTDRHKHTLPVKHEGGRHCIDHPLCHGDRIGVVGDARNDDRELVTAQTCSCVVGAHARSNPL